MYYKSASKVFLEHWNNELLVPNELEPLDIKRNINCVAYNLQQYSDLYIDDKELLTKVLEYIKAIATDRFWKHNITINRFFEQKNYPIRWEELLNKYNKHIQQGLVYKNERWIHQNSLNYAKIKPTEIKKESLHSMDIKDIKSSLSKLLKREISIKDFSNIIRQM